MSDKLSFQFNAKNKDQILFGQASGSMIEMPSVAGITNILRSDHPQSEKAKEKRLQRFLEIVEATRVYIEQLQRDINELEAGFRASDGDEWREKLALKVLEADEIPQRRDGENIEDYRERLEPILINKMLNKDGSIKPQYLNEPELSDYAQWAQKQYHLNSALGYVQELEDSNTSPERKIEIYDNLEKNADIEELVFAQRETKAESEMQGRIKDTADNVEDDKFAAQQSNGDLSAFIKPPS